MIQLELNSKIAEYINTELVHVAVQLDVPLVYPIEAAWLVPTYFGALRVELPSSAYSLLSVWMRFESPTMLKNGQRGPTDANHYSGKWNFHTDALAADTAFTMWRAAIDPWLVNLPRPI